MKAPRFVLHPCCCSLPAAELLRKKLSIHMFDFVSLCCCIQWRASIGICSGACSTGCYCSSLFANKIICSVWLSEPWRSRAFPGAVLALSLVFYLPWLCPSLLVSSSSDVFSSLLNLLRTALMLVRPARCPWLVTFSWASPRRSSPVIPARPHSALSSGTKVFLRSRLILQIAPRHRLSRLRVDSRALAPLCALWYCPCLVARVLPPLALSFATRQLCLERLLIARPRFLLLLFLGKSLYVSVLTFTTFSLLGFLFSLFSYILSDLQCPLPPRCTHRTRK